MNSWLRVALLSLALPSGGALAQDVRELPVVLPETTDWDSHVVSWFGRRVTLVAQSDDRAQPCLLVEDFRSGGAWILSCEGRVLDTYPRTGRRFGVGSTCEVVLAGDYDGDGEFEYVRRVGAGWTFVSAVTDTSRWIVTGDELFDLGDLDGDGRAEFAIVTHFTRANGEARSRVTLRSYASDRERWRFDAQRTPGVVHARAARAIDLDHDGVCDVLGFVEDVAVVLSGCEGRRLVRLGELDGQVVRAAAALGDVDADGVEDFALGYPNADSCGPAHVDVVSARRDGRFSRLTGIGSFGERVISGADFDGDGAWDLVLPTDGCMSGEGVFVHSGRTRGLIRSFESDVNCHRVCSAVVVPDANADGVAEIAIGTTAFMGANCDDGSVTLWSGRDGERLQLWTWRTPAVQTLWERVRDAQERGR